MQGDVFNAIADPTRREIFDLLAGRSLPVNEVAEQFEISRPAVSKHLKVLEECGLVSVHKDGRKRFCSAEPDRLIEVLEWAAKYRKFWSNRLDALEQILARDDI
jgi:DNA-binding transcriptional ArsR family regulator